MYVREFDSLRIIKAIKMKKPTKSVMNSTTNRNWNKRITENRPRRDQGEAQRRAQARKSYRLRRVVDLKHKAKEKRRLKKRMKD